MRHEIERVKRASRKLRAWRQARRWQIGIVLAGMALTIPLWAQQSRVYRDGNAWVEEVSGTLPACRQLHVTTDTGNVSVEGNAPRVIWVVRKRSYAPTEAAARKDFARMRISAVKNGEIAVIGGRLAHRNLIRFNTDFFLKVPQDVQLVKVETRSGGLSFLALAGSILGSTTGGLVKLDDLRGPVKITSGGGNIEAGNLGSDLTIIGGGSIVHVNSLAGVAKVHIDGGSVFIGSAKSVDVQTGAGGVEVRKCFGDLRVSTGGGNVILGDVGGAVTADTTGGSVRLGSAGGRVQVASGGGSVQLFRLNSGAQVETGVGPIAVEFLNASAFSDSFLRTGSGNITVIMPGGMPVTVHASADMANGHGIVAQDFPGLKVSSEGNRMGPTAMYAEGTLNGGGPTLRVRTTMGQIEFRRSQ